MCIAYRLCLSLLLLLGLACQADDESAKVGAVLDRFHAAASKAQFDAYFGLFAPDGIFIGTDADERWTVAQFKAYAKPSFDQGKGWTYVMQQRHVDLAPDGNHAWFDELLDNAKLGRCRGTGVLRKVNGEWKIEQYHLTIPVPNAMALDLAQRIRQQAPNAQKE